MPNKGRIIFRQCKRLNHLNKINLALFGNIVDNKDMVIKEGKASLLTLFSGLEAFALAEVNVKLHDSGLIEVDGSEDDPALQMTCHVLNCELIWNFTPINVPVTPSGDGSVTPFRRKK